MTVEEFREVVRRVRSKNLTAREALCLAGMGMHGEAGEAAEVIKKHVFHGHALNRDKVISEVGDTLFYAFWVLDLIDSSLGEAMEMNEAKMKVRYPEGFTCEESRVRKDEEQPRPMIKVHNSWDDLP